jgi:CRP-like cAMP-binding protein
MAKARLLPDGSPLHNLLLSALPTEVYRAVVADIRMVECSVGDVLHDHGAIVRDVYFPNGGVFSVTNEMRDGGLVEVATVGVEGMLGVSVFLGEPLSAGRTLLQVPNGLVASMPVEAFLNHVKLPGPFRQLMGRYAHAHLLQIMQCTACNALHRLEQRCCRWLLQTHDRVQADQFQLKQEFLAIMLGVRRPTVTLVMGTLQKAGMISARYGRIQIVNRKGLEASSCECYEAIAGHFQWLRPHGHS